VICPITSKKLASNNCEVDTCRYCVSRTCQHEAVTALAGDREAIKNHYGLSEVEVMCDLYRVATAIQAAKYFEFIFERSISDMKKKDVEDISKTEDKYKSWNTNQTKAEFSDIVDMIVFISNNLT
jgi:hypothetical protein